MGVHSWGTLTHACGRVTTETGNQMELEALRHEATHRLGSQPILAASPARLARRARIEAEQFLASKSGFLDSALDAHATVQARDGSATFHRWLRRARRPSITTPRPSRSGSISADVAPPCSDRHGFSSGIFERPGGRTGSAGDYRTPCLKRMATAFERVSADNRAEDTTDTSTRR